MNDARELLEQRSRLGQEKLALSRQIADINAKCIKRLPNHIFRQLAAQKAVLVAQEKDRDMQLIEIKRQLRDAPMGVGKVAASYEARKQLVELRDKWQEVSAGEFDHGPTERLMAAQFVRDLMPILKQMFAKDTDERHQA